MTNIVEYIGKSGVRTAKDPNRMNKPAPGDKVYYKNGNGSAKFGRIDQINAHGIKGLISICDNGGSVFLNGSGTVSISGGPFRNVHIQDLEPRGTLEPLSFWNWGDNSPGAGQGIYYSIARPLFNLVIKEDSETLIKSLWDQAIEDDKKKAERAIAVQEAKNGELRTTTQPYKSTWSETTEDWYYQMLEVLPPERWNGCAFMVGEPMTTGPRGFVHSAYAKIGDRFFCKDDYLIDFDDKRYKQEIKEQFKC